MIHRLRTRDLFAFAGEIILSADRRAELDLAGGGASTRIKKAMVELLQQSRSDAEEARTRANGACVGDNTDDAAVEVREEDIFCEIVKISYGKGSKNPVSGPTAFYEPKKNVSASEVDGKPTSGAENPDMVKQNSLWSVGVVPQGEKIKIFFIFVTSVDVFQWK